MNKRIDEIDNAVKVPGLARSLILLICNRIDMLSTGSAAAIGAYSKPWAAARQDFPMF